MCPNLGAAQQYGKFPQSQTHQGEFSFRPGNEKSALNRPNWNPACLTGKAANPLPSKAWREGCELLVLGPGGQAFVDLGVVNDLAEQFLTERRQRTLPKFAGGLALFDENPLLRGDRAGVHAVGELVDGAAGDRIAFLDGPFDRGDAAVPGEQRGMIADAA